MSTIHVNTVFIFRENCLILLPLNILIISICYFISELSENCVIQFMEERDCKRKYSSTTSHFLQDWTLFEL